MARYIAVIHKDKGSEYGVSFPDFPGCVTAGKDLDEAAAMAEEALALHIEGLREDGEVIPPPSVLEEIHAHGLYKDSYAVLMVEGPSDKTVRINITAPEKDLSKIDRAADARGMTRSGFMVSASVAEAQKSSMTLQSPTKRTVIAPRGKDTLKTSPMERSVVKSSSSKKGSDQGSIRK